MKWQKTQWHVWQSSKRNRLGNCSLNIKRTAISWRSETTEHNNANSASTKKAVNNYDL